MVAQSAEMQPTDSDTSASQWSLCCVRFPTDSAVCLWARGAGGIPGETHSWEVIEFEGKRQHTRGDGAGDTVDLQKTTAKGVVGALLREDVVFSKQKSRFFFWNLCIVSGEFVLFNKKKTKNLLLWICIFFTLRGAEGVVFLQKNSTFANSQWPNSITLHSRQDHRMLKNVFAFFAFLFHLQCILMYSFLLHTLFAHSTAPLTLHTSVTLFKHSKRKAISSSLCASIICLLSANTSRGAAKSCKIQILIICLKISHLKVLQNVRLDIFASGYSLQKTLRHDHSCLSLSLGL